MVSNTKQCFQTNQTETPGAQWQVGQTHILRYILKNIVNFYILNIYWFFLVDMGSIRLLYILHVPIADLEQFESELICRILRLNRKLSSDKLRKSQKLLQGFLKKKTISFVNVFRAWWDTGTVQILPW